MALLLRDLTHGRRHRALSQLRRGLQLGPPKLWRFHRVATKWWTAFGILREAKRNQKETQVKPTTFGSLIFPFYVIQWMVAKSANRTTFQKPWERNHNVCWYLRWGTVSFRWVSERCDFWISRNHPQYLTQRIWKKTITFRHRWPFGKKWPWYALVN